MAFASFGSRRTADVGMRTLSDPATRCNLIELTATSGASLNQSSTVFGAICTVSLAAGADLRRCTWRNAMAAAMIVINCIGGGFPILRGYMSVERDRRAPEWGVSSHETRALTGQPRRLGGPSAGGRTTASETGARLSTGASGA